MVGKIIRPLIPFDMVFNKGIGILRFLRECLTDDYLIDVDKLRNVSDSEMLSLTLSNPTRNPLFPFVKEKYRDFSFLEKIDNDYEDIKRDYGEQILECSAFTDFGTSVIGMAIGIIDNIRPTIVVDTDEEKKHLKQFNEFSKAKVLYSSVALREWNSKDMGTISGYDPYYFEYIDDIKCLGIPNYNPICLVKKNICVKECAYNHAKLDEIREKDYPIARMCAFTFISLWKKEKNNE